MSVILERVFHGKINQATDIEVFLGDIAEIQETATKLFHKTIWPCINEAQRASQFGKDSAFFIARHYSKIAFYYYSTNYELDTAQTYLDRAIEGMNLYLGYPFDNEKKEHRYWFELSTAYLQRFQIFFKQSNKDLQILEKGLPWIENGLEAINKALSLEQSHEAYLRKWHYLQLLVDSGKSAPEDPLIWSKKYLEAHPNPSSDEYTKHAQIHGGELAKKRQLDEAQRWFENLLQIKKDPITYLCLGKVFNNMNRSKEALECFRKASSLNSEDLEIKLWFIFEEVNESIQKFREKDQIPSDEEMRNWLQLSCRFCSIFSENANSFVGETSVFIPLKELAEHLYMTQLPQIANILTRFQQYKFAIELYKCILKNIDCYIKADIFEKSEIVNLHIAIGGIYALQGTNDLGAGKLREDQQPSLDQAVANLHANSLDIGEQFLLEAIKLDKERLDSYSNLAGIYAAQKDENKLMDLWKQLELLLNHCNNEERKKSFSAPLFNLGSAHAGLMKDLKDPACEHSQKFYKLSLECDPNNWDAGYCLARILAIHENAEYWIKAQELFDGLKTSESLLPFGLSPLKKFSFYFCYSGILALCDDISGAKQMAIEASQSKEIRQSEQGLEKIQVLQSYLDHYKKIDLRIFQQEILKSIRTLQFDFPLGKWIHPTPLSIPRGNFIGYHGTIDLYLDEFANGIQPRQVEKRQFRGGGFYMTDDKEAASYFAMKKSKEEGVGAPILLKIYNSDQSTLIGQKVNSQKKIRREVFVHYHFIQSPIDGSEAFSQYYFPENSLYHLNVADSFEKVVWDENQYNAFMKKQFKFGC